MWLLETDGAVFGGKRLWLRPGKVYLFGRTASEFAVVHKTISRKHLTITVDSVARGEAQNVLSRSAISIEDLNTKSGTTVNGRRMKGEACLLDRDVNVILMGQSPDPFRISWNPVVLSFSFTAKELQGQPLARLADVEQLDVKLLADFNLAHTTHVVAKKRNTSKGLQALVGGKYLVSDSFVDAIRAAAAAPEDAASQEPSALEGDFGASWPDPLDYLPPRGNEPTERPSSAYAPDAERRDVFDGYTFIFYDQAQYENLVAPITSANGKALFKTVVPGQPAAVDDFVRAVKAEAGEKGLGSFEDGSEGKGVVVVRYLPSKGAHVAWYEEFFTSVSLRLDHRPIEQNEFLEAILVKDASMLRRPLQLAPPSQEPPPHAAAATSGPAAGRTSSTSTMDVDQPGPAPPPPLPRKGHAALLAARRRFAGFGGSESDSDQGDDPEKITQATSIAAPPSRPQSQDDGLFVRGPGPGLTRSQSEEVSVQRKRPAPLPSSQEDNVLDAIAPTAAAVKRRRIEAGEEPVPRRERQATASPHPAPEPAQAGKGKKIKKELDILDVARRQREEMEARARAEQEDLAHLPPDVDLAEIRRLHIVEDMEVRQGAAARRQGGGAEQDDGDGDDQTARWDPRWNGRQNFKRFRQRGAAVGRPVPKVIVPLGEVKAKDFGMGDEYWLESDGEKGRTKNRDTQRSSEQETPSQTSRVPGVSRVPAAGLSSRRQVVDSDDDGAGDDDDNSELGSEVQDLPELLSTIPGPGAESRHEVVGSGAKNPDSNPDQPSQPIAQTEPSQEAGGGRQRLARERQEPAKKPRTGRQKIFDVQDSDESDDELKFRFGKRK